MIFLYILCGVIALWLIYAIVNRLKDNEYKRARKEIEREYEAKYAELQKLEKKSQIEYQAKNSELQKLEKKSQIEYQAKNSELQNLYQSKNESLQELEKKATRTIERFNKELANVDKRKQQAENEINMRVQEFWDTKLEKDLYISKLIADNLSIFFDISAKYLETKKHPAPGKAHDVKELKKIFKDEKAYRLFFENRYNLIKELFPNIVDLFNDTPITSFALEGEDDVDNVRKYISEEEYRLLSVTERNQLALDNYIKNRKTDWQVGRDYELSVGYFLSTSGYDVQYFGIEKRLEDLGRDIIAVKDEVVYVIQCKNWSQAKEIYECHINQLFGTTTHYKIEHTQSNKIIPLFITTTNLSEMAKKFATALDVVVWEQFAYMEFPRIKCNINSAGERIYHLPFDQQYDRTQIKKSGEFFAWTVVEAENAGFRRAFRHRGECDL